MKTKDSGVLMAKIYKLLRIYGRRSLRRLLLVGVALLLTLYLYTLLATKRSETTLCLSNRQIQQFLKSREQELRLRTQGVGRESMINEGVLHQYNVINDVDINAKELNEIKVQANVTLNDYANRNLPNSINEQSSEYETPMVFNSYKIMGAQNEDRRSVTENRVLHQENVIKNANMNAKELNETKVQANVKINDDANQNLPNSSNEQSDNYVKPIDFDQHKITGGLNEDNTSDKKKTEDTGEPPPTFIPYEPDTSPLGRPPTIPKRFVIEEADYCHRRPGLQIITYVHSSIWRISQRNLTRITWANASAYDMGDISVKIGVVFMVGRAKNDEEQRIIQEESQRYHDIVQGDYGDHYRLLTYKGLAGLYWISRHCSHVPWTLHSDDDTHIDIFLYHRALQELDTKAREMFVCSHMYGPVLRTGRWNVRIEEYPENDYPLYCSGGVWFLQTKLVPQLLEASKSVPFLWVDDAYITGLLAKKAGIEQFPFHMYYGNANVKVEKLGQEVAWFVKFAPRWVWWDKIVKYHRKHSMHNPFTLIPPSE